MHNIHVIKNEKGKFDVVTKISSDVVYHTRQGYERKGECYDHIRGMMNIFGTPKDRGVFFQDDTDDKAVVCYIDTVEVVITVHKPGPKYEPK